MVRTLACCGIACYGGKGGQGGGRGWMRTFARYVPLSLPTIRRAEFEVFFKTDKCIFCLDFFRTALKPTVRFVNVRSARWIRDKSEMQQRCTVCYYYCLGPPYIINYKNIPRTIRNTVTANVDTTCDRITISFVTRIRRLWSRFSKVPVDFVRTAP